MLGSRIFASQPEARFRARRGNVALLLGKDVLLQCNSGFLMSLVNTISFIRRILRGLSALNGSMLICPSNSAQNLRILAA